MFEDEGDIVSAHGEAVTDTRLQEAPLRVLPDAVVRDVVAQPGREVPYGEAHARGAARSVAFGDDDERDDSEGGEGEDDEEGDDEVEVECGVDAAQRADEAESGDDGNEEAAE